MHVIEARNVCEALPKGLEYLLYFGEPQQSRNGPVIVAPGPVTTVYERPTERVLFSAVRDANPFLHLMESLWMLAGRDDVAFLNRFVGDFGARYGEADGRLHGAYGHRWRRALGFDQLDHVVEVLRRDPTSRQCVVQMWDASWFDTSYYGSTPEHDRPHEIGCDDLRGSWRDRPCNTHVYLRVREQPSFTDKASEADRRERRMVGTYNSHVLDITVCCRSNDIIWGAYGANAVHFSVLQEYLAARIGVGVGRYYQVSNNYHAYVSEIDRLCGRCAPPFVRAQQRGGSLVDCLSDNRYIRHSSRPLVDVPEAFDAEVRTVLAAYETGFADDGLVEGLGNSFLERVVVPALRAHSEYREKSWGLCKEYLDCIRAPDWRVAMTEWIDRR